MAFAAGEPAARVSTSRGGSAPCEPPTGEPSPPGRANRSARSPPFAAIFLSLLLLASAAFVLVAQRTADPLAPYRAPDGSLHIPGGALTPELEHLLFGGNDLQPYLNLTFYVPAHSAYATADLVPRPYLTPNPNVVVRSDVQPVSLAGGVAEALGRWFPPMDWGAQVRGAMAWFFGLFTWDARASVALDSTTVADVTAAANTCTTSQAASGSDNAVLVLLSERGTTTFLSVTYGTTALNLIAGTAANGGTSVRTEIWGFAGTLPGGAVFMTATLSGGGTAKMTCATILLSGVSAGNPFINGTSVTGTTANAGVTLTGTVGVGNLAFALASLLQTGGGGVQPTGVTGTGAAATDLFGVATGHCTGTGGSNECAAGASIPNPGTAVTWTNPATTWAVAAVEVVQLPSCGTTGGANCYRIGAGGNWGSTTSWSTTSNGPPCGCAPVASDIAIFNAFASGTTTLTAATTIGGIDMTGFSGTLDTSASNWALTVNGNVTIQSIFLPRGSTLTITGNVTVLGAATYLTMSTSVWTVNGTWTNNSTSATWSAGTSTVTIQDAASGTLTFGNLAVNEFNNLTLDASVPAGLTYMMATNGLRVGGTLTIRNSTIGATGSTILDTSAANLAITTATLTIATFGAANTEASTVTVNGNATISAANGYLRNTGGSWVVTGVWSDASTSASWSFAAPITFRSAVARTMTFGPQAGNEFSGAVTFDTTVTTAVTYTLSTNSLDVGGTITVQDTAAGATGPVILDTSAGNLAITAGGITVTALTVLNTRTSTITVNGTVNISATTAYITNTGGTWTVSGAWTDRTTSASWAFAAAMTFRSGTAQTMTFTGSNIAGNEFAGSVTFDSSVAGGATFTMAAGATGDASLKVGGALTIRNSAGGATSASILDTSAAGSYRVTAPSLTLGNPRGALKSEGSIITINGNVNISDPGSYLAWGSAAWTVTGAWTDSSTDAVDWSVGTSTVTFKDAANATMTFANLGASEFNNVVFDTTTALGMTYTMATNGLRAAGTFTVQNTAPSPTGNVTLTTGPNLALIAGSVVLGVRGSLTANGSTVTVGGSWTSTAANHVWNKGTSTVVFNASGVVTMAAGESFNILTQSAGTTTLGSSVTVSGAAAVNGTLDTSAANLTLTLQSTLSIGPTGVLNLEASSATTSGNVTVAAGGAVRFTGSATWTINGSWTDSNGSVPASWALSTATVRIVDAAAATLTFWTAAGNEFNNLSLDASLAAGFTYSQVNGLQVAGTLTVQNSVAGATGPVVLDASGANYAANLGGLTLGTLGAYNSRGATVTAGSVGVAASGYITTAAAGAWTVTGSWANGTTSASWSFAAAVTFRSAASQTMTFKMTATEFAGGVTFDTTATAGITYTLASNALTLSGLLTVRNTAAGATGNTILDTSTSNLGITAGSVMLGTDGTLRANGSTITVGGNWTGTATNATFTAGTSTVVFTANATITMTQAFSNLSISAGTAALGANATASATITVSGGVLAKGTFTLSAGALTLSGGALTSTSGGGTVTGNVAIGSAASYIAFGSETWTVGGSWMNASTSASWSAGTGTVVFNDAAAATMIFAGSNLAGSEFNNVTFDTTAAAGVAYTLSTNALRIGGVLTIRNSTASPTGNTVLDTSGSGLALSAGSVTLGTDGTLKANGSTVSVSGNWTSTAAGAVLNAGTSTVVLTAPGTVTTGGSQSFNILTVSAGTATAGSAITTNALNVNGGTFAKGANALTVNGNLVLAGGALTSSSGNAAVTGNVSISSAASYIAFGSETWTIGGSWTNASTSASWSAGSGSVLFVATSAQTMAFAGSNLGVSEFNNVTFNAGASAVTFTMATRGLQVAGILTVGGGSAVTTLDTSAGGLSITSPNVTVSTNGALTANGSAIAVTSMDTHLGSFGAGTSTIVVSASGGSLDIPQTVANLTVNAGVSTTVAASLTWTGSLTLTGATVSFGGSSLTSSGAATITFASATLTMDTGDWDTSSATGFTGTGSSVTFSNTGTLNPGATAALGALTISGGTRTLLSQLTTNGLLTVSGGILSKGTNPLRANAGLVLSGGALASTSGAVSVTGDVSVSAAASYITFGSEAWTVSGAWTNTSTSVSWSAGTGSVTFTSAASHTMTFAALPGGAPEFDNVTFDSGASAATFTMATNGLVWSGTLQVQGGSATTTLATGNLALTGGTLSVGNAGALTANASSVAVTSVSMTGGTSGTITLTTGAWTVSGNWDTSGAGSALTAGTSTVTFSGPSATVDLAAGQAFCNATVTGNLTLLSSMAATSTLTVGNAAVLTTTGQSIAFNTLAETGNGSIVNGTVTVVNLSVVNSDPTNVTTISLFSLWTTDAEYRWTDASTVGSSTITFTIAGNTSGSRFTVTKDGSAFTTGFVNGSGQVVFTMLGSDPVVDVVVAAPCAGTRYWVGGAGNWSQTAHWSATSGGAGGCSVPMGTTTVQFDANSGGGSVTVDQNAALASLSTAGWTGTISVGTFNFAVGGNLTLAGGTLTVGASAGTGLTVGGSMTLSGNAVLDGSGGASVVEVSGNAAITSATAYLRMGSGTWTFAGSWSNASTSSSWASGSGTVVFTAASSQTMTFAALSGTEFFNVTFASTAAGGTITFALATHGLTWGGTLTVQDSAGSTTTLATANLALTGGSLAVGNGGALTANASAVSLVNVTMTGGTSGAITLTTGAWTVSGNWDTSGAGSALTAGTSAIALTAGSGTLKILNASNGFNNLSVTGSVTLASAIAVGGVLAVTGSLTTAGYGIGGGASLTISAGGTLAAGASSIAVTSVTMADGFADTLSLTSGSVTVSGSWDTSGSSAVFGAGTSSVFLTAASGTVALGASQSFGTLTIVGVYAATSQLSAASLTISSGGLAKGTNALTVAGTLNLSGGYLTSVSGNVTIGADVDISAAASYIAFGSEAWTVSGSWTNASTSASWSPGTGSVTFIASTSLTFTLAGTNLPSLEFNAVVFDAGASTVIFTLAGSALQAQTVTIQGGPGTTTVDTSSASLAITAATLTVAAGGALSANGSVVTVHSMDTSAGAFTAGTSTISVNASGGTVRVPQAICDLTVNPGVSTTFASNLTWSGALILSGATATFQGSLTASGGAGMTFMSATLTVAGSWTTTSAGTFTGTGSSVTFTGMGQTLAVAAGQAFATLTIAGSVAILSDVTATTLTVSPGATLTASKGQITFNALTVNGRLTDGSVNVTNLTVTNSDATALVTISVFTTWNAGSEYAWSHTSSESSQTITWTIGGNTVKYPYHVTKDGSAFASGTVDANGAVVFTMLGSDPNMVVTVSPPPVPAWWQSPYFLAIPPIGFLMVVAMFVQRRRWRPAKAFLVDERGQLLREFSLDPSCAVTYDQAKQAGALDAVDKDVRVSKYHARAVHGDMLSLIMLAVGPANIEEVEFARGMLVSIQDKLEDQVKARVQEARTEEAAVEEARTREDEERTDLQTRARVFGDMVNAFTIARSKLNRDSEKLGGLDADLREREAQLAGERTALEAREAEAETQRTDLEKTAADLETHRGELQATEDRLGQRESVLAPREQDLERRLEEIAKQESDLGGHQADLATGQAKLAADLDDYRAKAEQAVKLQEELADERKALDELSVQIGHEEEALRTKTAEVEAHAHEVATTSERLQNRMAELEPRERAIETSESEIAAREAALGPREDVLSTRERDFRTRLEDLTRREAALATRAQDLAEEREALDKLATEAVAERQALEAKTEDLAARGAAVAQKTRDLEDLKGNLGPREAAIFRKEADLAAREKSHAEEQAVLLGQQDLVAAKALEIEQQLEAIKDRESALAQEKILFQDAKGALEEERRSIETRKEEIAADAEQRGARLAEQERTLGDARMHFTKDTEAFEAQRLEKEQWIASKEIELEAKAQGLADREAEIRAQAEANGRQLADLAMREESLEIDGDKLDKARAELESRKAEVSASSRDLEAKTARFRDEEAHKGEELRTWQATLESEQALLKEQKETFDKEMQDLRESWAGRMLRVEQREEELQERETKTQADVEWVARNDADLAKREKAIAENLKAASELKTQAERLRADLEQRGMELDSRERGLREEAAEQSVALEKRMEALQIQETELAGRRAQWETELATQTQKVKSREEDLEAHRKELDGHEADLATRETDLLNERAALRQDEDRLARDRADQQTLQAQLESRQLELSQTRERLDAETARLRTETDAVRQSLAAKEADLTSERERLERESSALQDKLGTKAREMATREKAVTAREEELRSEEHDLEAKTREIETRERQSQAHLAELTAREKALETNEADQKARHAGFDETVRQFHEEAASRQKEWTDLQATLKSQEAQLAANAETRQAEIRKRLEDLEQRERTVNATLTQSQIERTRLADQGKAQAAKESQLEAAAGRADKRLAELKSMEDELLRARQGFESEKTAWSGRRSEELKQLEATRDAAAEQTQQAERLIEDAQRRAYVAAEAEKASKRQGEELAAAQTVLEKRRADAEKAEQDLEAQMAQLRDASQRLGAKELELGSKAKDLDALQTRLTEVERKSSEAVEAHKARKTSLDQESERIAALAAQIDKRQAEADARQAAVEGKLADVTKREQILTTELQRADNLMEDLSRKEAQIAAREKGLTSRDQDLAKREQILAQRDVELRDGMQALERLGREQQARTVQTEEDRRTAAEARREAEGLRSEAEKLKAQADAMQAEVAKNMRFLQKKALDVLDREEKLRMREAKIDEQNRLLESRAQILEQKDRAFEAEREDLTVRLEKAKLEQEKLKAKLAESERTGRATIDMDEWKRDIDNRVKIIQKKALDLLDREEKLRKKEEELHALAAQLGVHVSK